MKQSLCISTLVVLVLLSPAIQRISLAQTRAGGTKSPVSEAGMAPPAGYVIGPDDLLTIRFWGDAPMSGDVVVRPDGKISIPLLDDVQAAGLTPEQLNE